MKRQSSSWKKVDTDNCHGLITTRAHLQSLGYREPRGEFLVCLVSADGAAASHFVWCLNREDLRTLFETVKPLSLTAKVCERTEGADAGDALVAYLKSQSH